MPPLEGYKLLFIRHHANSHCIYHSFKASYSVIPTLPGDREGPPCLPAWSKQHARGCGAAQDTQGNLGVPTKVQVSCVEKLPTLLPRLQAQAHAA